MNSNLVIDIPLDELPTISVRAKKYITCLQLVQRVISRELQTDISLSLFNQIGIVAGFIDQHLDALDKTQQQTLAEHYDELFNILWRAEHYLLFKYEVCTFVAQNKYEFTCESLHIKDLYMFMQHCKSENLEEGLRHFGKCIINCALQKREASTSYKLQLILKKEGQAVVSLLHALLKSTCGSNSKLPNTLNLLTHFEHLLNLADDTLDAGSDRRKGLVNHRLGLFHGMYMAFALFIQLIKTFGRFPLKMMYYAPRLSWQYLRNAY
jgi:hypothetical protein